MELASWRKRLLPGCHLHVLYIGALNVERWKTALIKHNGLRSVDVVQCPITKSVCQGVLFFLNLVAYSL
jgi:hypothetical protein